MDRLSEEEFAARFAYLQEQKALAKAAAEAAAKEMKINDDIEMMRRQQKQSALIDLTAESSLNIKMEILHTPESEELHNDEEPDAILFNETPINTPAHNNHDLVAASVTAERDTDMRHRHLALLNSDVPEQRTTQPEQKRESSESSVKTTSTDHQRFPQIVEDDEYRTITRALEGDDLVELRCKICNGNCGRYSNTLLFFRGVSGFRTHIQVSHPSSLPAGGRLTARDVVQLCIHRTLSEKEKHAVLNGDHTAYKVDKVLAGGADAGAPIHAPRAPRGKRSRLSQEVANTMEDVVIRSRSSDAAMTATGHALATGGVDQDDDEIEVSSQQAPKMKTRGGGKRRKHFLGWME
ncbi:hypothetical protein TI39_contig305g00037 [Zymoseptoria brevis]|uniref:Uncharacterized protein n=1 Tax=Zymoseptoria brevis TaxID=1047168 RepID=A0A0F4GUF5_9PEZI|nr:hypothetical protein TI39_contig305g00037 [Zymoseptoria brevis]